MLRTLGLIYGFIFLIAGVAGLIPELTPKGLLLDLFRVNTPHDLLNIGCGVIGLMCAVGGLFYTRVYFILTGLTFLVIAACGFMIGEGELFGLFAINMADNWTHGIISATALFIGFFI